MSNMRGGTNAVDGVNNESTTINLKRVDNGNNERARQLRQYLHDVVQTETEATEDRIDQYAKQQNALLKMFREKADQDYHDILR